MTGRIVVERCPHELGDWRVCVLTPFGSRSTFRGRLAVSGAFAPRAPRVEDLWVTTVSCSLPRYG